MDAGSTGETVRRMNKRYTECGKLKIKLRRDKELTFERACTAIITSEK